MEEPAVVDVAGRRFDLVAGGDLRAHAPLQDGFGNVPDIFGNLRSFAAFGLTNAAYQKATASRLRGVLDSADSG